MIERQKYVRSGIKLAASIVIFAAAVLLTAAPSHAFTLIEKPASQLDLFSPVSVHPGEIVRLNAANLLGDGSVRVLFKFFDGEGNTLKEEIRTLEVGQAASIDFTPAPRTEPGDVLVQGLIAVLREGGGGISSRKPMSSLLELRSAPSTCDGSVRTVTGFLPAVQKFNFIG